LVGTVGSLTYSVVRSFEADWRDRLGLVVGSKPCSTVYVPSYSPDSDYHICHNNSIFSEEVFRMRDPPVYEMEMRGNRYEPIYEVEIEKKSFLDKLIDKIFGSN